jgi:hypothetical protein
MSNKAFKVFMGLVTAPPMAFALDDARAGHDRRLKSLDRRRLDGIGRVSGSNFGVRQHQLPDHLVVLRQRGDLAAASWNAAKILCTAARSNGLSPLIIAAPILAWLKAGRD